VKRLWLRCLLLVLAAGLMAVSGCAYTTVARKAATPKPGPSIATGTAAVMPQVRDSRPWPKVMPKRPIANVRLYPPQITEQLRRELVQEGLFTRLLDPADPAASGISSRLRLELLSFKLAKLGHNAWVVPHLLADGALLPLFAVVNLASQGQVDMGAYFIPSTKMGITLKMHALYREKGLTVLERSYLVDLPLEAVSGLELRQALANTADQGAELGRKRGRQALSRLARVMARDPHWAYLPDYRRLARARRDAAPKRLLEQRVQAVRSLLDLLRPLDYTPREANLLRDGNLTPAMRAAVVNQLRAQRLGLASPERLPAKLRLDESKAQALFDDPAVARAQVEGNLARQVLVLALEVLSPAARKGAKVLQTPAQRRLRAELAGALVQSLRGRPNLQALLIQEADRAVGRRWPVMRALLKDLGSPQALAYLAARTR